MKKRIVSNSIIGLCLVAIAIGIGGLCYEGLRGGASSGLSEAGLKATNDLLERRKDVFGAMGKHPDSEAVFQELVALWRVDTGWEDLTIYQKLAEAFRNEDLGLYALRVYYDKAPAGEASHTFSEYLIVSRPDSRAACMALDRQLKADEAGAVARCEAIVARNGADRLHRFALTRLGNEHLAQGRHREAQNAWYRAWAADPASGPQLHNKLYKSWLATDDWFAPTILGTEYLDDPAIRPLLERLAARVADPAVGEIPEISLLAPVLSAGDLNALRSHLQRFLETWGESERTDIQQAEFALALALLQPEKVSAESAVGDSLILWNELDRYRSEFRTLAIEALPAISPSLRAIYLLRIADQSIEGVRPRAALAVLQARWIDTDLDAYWRKAILLKRAEILEVELGQPLEAAKNYAAHCEAGIGDSASYRAKAGQLFYDGGDIAAALKEFVKLSEESEEEDAVAYGLLMQSVCKEDLDDSTNAQALLNRIVKEYPEADCAPTALWRMSSMALAEEDITASLAYLEQLRMAYPDWDSASQVAPQEKILKELGSRNR